jgi:hypothetical protein
LKIKVLPLTLCKYNAQSISIYGGTTVIIMAVIFNVLMAVTIKITVFSSLKRKDA